MTSKLAAQIVINFMAGVVQRATERSPDAVGGERDMGKNRIWPHRQPSHLLRTIFLNGR